MPNKAFLEITNQCNLCCSFCHGTKRPIKYMTSDEFKTAASRLTGFADYLYFHLMGEPLLHPLLGDFFEIAGDLGFKVIITTNGTLIKEKTDLLLAASSLRKISISLHSFESDSEISPDNYLNECFDFCLEASKRGIICVMRLWNIGGNEKLNSHIISHMHSFFENRTETVWKEIYSGYKIGDNLFLEWGERFDWPDIDGDFLGDQHFCYALRDQVGILSDGTVVPCCLDADGVISLGNIFENSLEEILSSERAENIKKSFEKRKLKEELCRKCGYAHKKNYGK